MPYKDPDIQREYEREYKRQQRGKNMAGNSRMPWDYYLLTNKETEAEESTEDELDERFVKWQSEPRRTFLERHGYSNPPTMEDSEKHIAVQRASGWEAYAQFCREHWQVEPEEALRSQMFYTESAQFADGRAQIPPNLAHPDLVESEKREWVELWRGALKAGEVQNV